MSKIPVGDTISRSYSFGFTNILSVLGIAWLPYAILVAIAIGLVMLLAPDLPRMLLRGQFDPFMFAHVSRVFGLLGILSYIVACMVMVGIQRKALGKHPGPEFVYFSLGAPVWRMAGALFLAGLVILLIALLTAGVVVGIWFAAGKFVPGFALVIRCLAITAACLWFIYMAVRLTFFLPAVVVAEERIGLGRSWELGGGNFWRIVVVVIAVFLPVAIGFAIVSSALIGPFFVMPHMHAGMDFRELARQFVHQSLVLSPFAIVLIFVRRIVYLGLSNGMIANAYLAVTAGAPSTAQEPA